MEKISLQMKDKICEPRCVKINASGLDLESERRLNKREREREIKQNGQDLFIYYRTGIKKKERERKKSSA